MSLHPPEDVYSNSDSANDGKKTRPVSSNTQTDQHDHLLVNTERKEKNGSFVYADYITSVMNRKKSNASPPDPDSHGDGNNGGHLELAPTRVTLPHISTLYGSGAEREMEIPSDGDSVLGAVMRLAGHSKHLPPTTAPSGDSERNCRTPEIPSAYRALQQAMAADIAAEVASAAAVQPGVRDTYAVSVSHQRRSSSERTAKEIRAALTSEWVQHNTAHVYPEPPKSSRTSTNAYQDVIDAHTTSHASKTNPTSPDYWNVHVPDTYSRMLIPKTHTLNSAEYSTRPPPPPSKSNERVYVCKRNVPDTVVTPKMAFPTDLHPSSHDSHEVALKQDKNTRVTLEGSYRPATYEGPKHQSMMGYNHKKTSAALQANLVLDEDGPPDTHIHRAKEFQSVAHRLQSVLDPQPKVIQQHPPKMAQSHPTLHRVGTQAPNLPMDGNVKRQSLQQYSVVPNIAPKEVPKKKRHGRSRSNNPLNPDAIAVMTDWYEQNLDNPYPSEAEKHRMAEDGNISVTQVNSWFSNKRNRSNNTKPKQKRRKLESQIMNLCQSLISQSRKKSIDHGEVMEHVCGIMQMTGSAEQDMGRQGPPTPVMEPQDFILAAYSAANRADTNVH